MGQFSRSKFLLRFSAEDLVPDNTSHPPIRNSVAENGIVTAFVVEEKSASVSYSMTLCCCEIHSAIPLISKDLEPAHTTNTLDRRHIRRERVLRDLP